MAGAAPNREERAACWNHRDAYFTCLDQNGVIAAGDDKGPCQKEKKGYEGSCSRSWVSHGAAWILWGELIRQIDYFNKRRTLEMRQKATVDAAAKARDENVANRGR